MAHLSSSELPRSASDGDAKPSDPYTHVLPGPYRWEVLRKRTQGTHVSQLVWNEDKVRGLKTRREKLQGGPCYDDISDVVADYLTHADFIHVARMSHIQDVADILGLPTDGQAVTKQTALDWTVVCQQVFGIAPVVGRDIFGGDLRISYMDRLYADWGLVVHDLEEVRRYSRAHILRY
ncbi:uncharacterized protein LOC133304084 [Gastrolobium bilobum]|uniref:uncharacterized protein LOC133304084 n=1 Tax=Gastrolobium bilobum TaxID=150636 RepID=UPI002AB1D352|nr:uncharacterized protein LOC133304084 [Gastrolobium bilobum]